MKRFLALLLAAALAACGPDPVDPHAGHDHGPGGTHDHAHVHSAPRGGVLVVLSEERVNMELLADPETGHLSALVLGAHAEKAVRIAQETIALTIEVGGETHQVELPAVASELTGETVGDTSEFAAEIPVLKGVGTFEGSIASVTVRGETYTDLAFTYP